MGDSRKAAAEEEEHQEYLEDMRKAQAKLGSMTPQIYHTTMKKMSSLMNNHQYGLSSSFIGNSFQHAKMNELRELIETLQP